MRPNGGIITVAGLEFSHVAVDDARILAMSHDAKRSGIGKDLIERLVAVDEHIPRAAAHKELDAGNAVRVELTE